MTSTRSRRTRPLLGVLLAVGLGAGVLVAGPASSEPAATCAGPAEGGDWKLYGNTPDNNRHQTEETRLGPDTATFVEPAWTFNAFDVGLDGGFSSTPIIQDGCLYAATITGYVVALNADTGELVWASEKLEGNGVETSAYPITNSPTVVGDTIYVGVTRSGSPYVAALDRWTGKTLWTSVIENAQPSSFTVPAPVVHKGNLLQGFSVYFADGDEERGGYVVLDADRECSTESATTCANPVPGANGGKLKVHRYTIPDAHHEAQGFQGAGVWCTGAVDVETSYVYACTSNPASPNEHRFANSLLKIDLDESRPTFGQIVDAYKGTPDNYVPGIERQPACETLPGATDPYYSATCVQFDLDFGASPNLFRNSLGELMVGSLQKSGVFHTAYADNMQGAWTTVVGTPCLFFCNGSSPATDGEKIYTVGSPGGVMWGLDRDKGTQRFAAPVGNPFHYHPTSVANGVAYTVNGLGTLVGIDTATGRPVLERSVAVDTGVPVAEMNSSGVAIARSTLYVMSGEQLVAYK